MMKLIADAGNTLCKFAVFNGDKCIQLITESNPDRGFIAGIVGKFGIATAILSSVIEDNSHFDAVFNNLEKYIKLSDQTPVSVKNCYKSRETLGMDRLASAIGAHHLFPGKPVLSVDCGTCIKFNFVNAAGEFLGGSISPGIQMRLKSLQHFTQKLPLVEARDIDLLIGQTTEESILSGVITGARCETDGMISLYLRQYPSMITILTGGDMNYFENSLKNSIFADPILVMKGLNKILDFNA